MAGPNEVSFVHIQVARGQSWHSLPEDLRRRICVELLEQRSDAAWLSVLEDMHKQEPGDPRLTAVCAKALCDHRNYDHAFAVIRRSIVDRTKRTFSKDADGLMKHLAQYTHDMDFLSRIKRHVDIENRKDALPRPTSDEVERAFVTASNICRSMLPVLSSQDQARLLLTLLDLAESSDSEQCILQAAEMFVQSSAINDVTAYAEFVHRLQTASIYTRISTWRPQFIAKFQQHIQRKNPQHGERRIPNERAFLRLFQKETGYRLEKCMDGTEAEAVRLISMAISLASRMGVGTRSVQKAAREVLQGLEDPSLKLDLCLQLIRLDEPGMRLLVARTIRECVSIVTVRPDQVLDLAKEFLIVNDAEQLRVLHARGLLDAIKLPPSHLASLYATMGLFGEGTERMRRARQAAIVAFSETGEIDFFQTATTITEDIAEFEFLQRCSDILNNVPQPKTPRGLLVVVAKGPHELNQFPLLAIRELKQRGYAVVPLAAGSLQYQPTGIPEIDDIAEQLNLGLNHARCELEAIRDSQPNWLSRIPLMGKLFEREKWVWDPASYELSYAGINAYWGIREDLGCRERRYSVDFDSPRYTVFLADIKKRIESWELCLRKISAVGKTRGIPVRLMLQYVHLSTHYYCRKYVESASAEQDISVIHSAIAYENYFSNFLKDESTTLAVQDMTRLTDLAASSYAPSAWFLCHYKSLSDDERNRIVEIVEQVTKQNRVRRDNNTNAQQRLQFFKAERERGRRVVALFGKVLFDQGLPRGDGVVHEDMRDWFDHSIDIARRNREVHLIIKPHPHELRDEIALYASEVLKDWLPNSVPKNVHFLSNDEFNLHELAEILDLALVWNGMSALELGVLKVPTILGAYYGIINFPVGHMVPTSREDFERIVVSYRKNELPTEVRRMSAALIDYLRHPDVSVPYRYTYRGLTNKHIDLHWFDEDLKAYETNGDPHVKVLADRLEGVAYAQRSQ